MQPDRNVDILAVERTLLAAERTFSAWIRTGLAGVGGGLAIAHALVFTNPLNHKLAQVSGFLLVLWGTGLFIYALIDYRRTCARLTRETDLKKSLGVLLPMTALLLIVVALVLWIML
ncbi:MAG: DUF202 domain-containing protein [FCB group bacterium]|jgi:putative membrane protein|nr:DUF202 domain-containing protein [FCB group bacterium]